MGCWNESDMLMHLPIYPGEEVYLVILTTAKARLDSCYPNSMLTPLFAIKGKYDSYGRIEFYDKKQAHFLLSGINSSLAYPYEDFYEFQECIHDQMNGFGNKHDNRLFRKVFLKADLMDTLVKQARKDSFLLDINDCLEKLKNKSEDEPTSIYLTNLLWSINCTKSIYPMMYEYFAAIYKKDPEKTIELYKLLVGFHITLRELRASWNIPSGTGSQESVTKTMELFYREGAKEIKNLKSNL